MAWPTSRTRRGAHDVAAERRATRGERSAGSVAPSARPAHLPADLAVGGVDPARHAHAVEEVADGQGEGVADRRDDLDRDHLRVGDRGAPVREQVGDGVVELLVAHARGAAAGRRRTCPWPCPRAGPGASARKCSQCATTIRRAVGTSRAPARERLQHVGVGQAGVGDEQRHGAAGGDDPWVSSQRLLARAGGAHVVLALVAGEAVDAAARRGRPRPGRSRGAATARRGRGGHDEIVGGRCPRIDAVRIRLDLVLRRHRLPRLGRPAGPAHRAGRAVRGARHRAARAGRGADLRRSHRQRRARPRTGRPPRRRARRPGALGRPQRGAAAGRAGAPGQRHPRRRPARARGPGGARRLRRPVLGAVAPLRLPRRRRPRRSWTP